METLLIPSKITLRKIYKLLKNSTSGVIKVLSQEETKTLIKDQHFTFGNFTYIINDLILLKKVQDIIDDSTPYIFFKNRKKVKFNVFKDINEILDIYTKTPSLSNIDKDFAFLNTKVKKPKNNELQYCFMEIIANIGTTHIANTIEKILTIKYKETLSKFDSDITENFSDNSEEKFTYISFTRDLGYIICDEILSQILLSNKFGITNTKEIIKLLKFKYTTDISEMRLFMEINFDIKLKNDLIIKWVYNYLLTILVEKKTQQKLLLDISNDLLDITLTIGSHITEILIKHGILELHKKMGTSRTKNKGTFLKIPKKYSLSVLASAIAEKPLLDSSFAYQHKSRKTYIYDRKLYMQSNNSIIRENNKDYTLEILNPKLTEVLTGKHAPFCVSKHLYNAFKIFLENILENFENCKDIKQFIATQYNTIILYYKIIFNIDITNILTQILDNSLDTLSDKNWKNILKSSFDFNDIWGKSYIDTEDKRLLKEIKSKLRLNKGAIEKDLNNKQLKKERYLLVVQLKLLQKFAKMYQILGSRKFHFVTLIHDINLMSNFKCFYISKFITYIARMFDVGGSLHFQNHKISRAFIMYYLPESQRPSERNFQTFQQAFISNIDLTSIEKEEFLALTFTQFEQLNKKEHLNLILSALNKNLSDTQMESITTSIGIDITKIKEDLLFLEPLVKEHSQILNTLNLLYDYHNPQTNVVSTFILDASNSGNQILSIYFNDKDSATMYNVAGIIKEDLYLKYPEEYKKEFEILEEYYDKIKCYIIEKDLLKDLYPQKIVYQILNAIKTNKAFTKLQDPLIYVELINQISIIKELPLLSNINESDLWLVLFKKELFNEFALPDELKPHMSCLLILNSLLLYKKYLNDNKWIETYNVLKNRKVSKGAIMSFTYNMTSYGRIKYYEKYLYNAAFELSILEVNHNAIKNIAIILEKYFSLKFKPKYLLLPSKYNQLSTCLASSNEEIIIETPFIKTRFFPLKKGLLRRIPRKNPITNKRIGQITVQKNMYIFNKTKCRSAFCPIFIQAGDAFIAQHFLITIQQMFENTGLSCPGTVNHDAMIFAMIYACVGKYIIRNSYKELYKVNWIDKFTKYLIDTKRDSCAKEFLALQVSSSNHKSYLTVTDICNPHAVKYG